MLTEDMLMQNTDLYFGVMLNYFEGWSNHFINNVTNDNEFRNNMLIQWGKLIYAMKESSYEDSAFMLYSYDKSCSFLIDMFIKRSIYGQGLICTNEIVDNELASLKVRFKNTSDEVSSKYKSLIRRDFTKSYYMMVELWIRLTMLTNLTDRMDNLLQDDRLLYFEDPEINIQTNEMLSYYSSQIVAREDVKKLIKKAYEGINTDVIDSGVSGAIAGGILLGPIGALAGAALSSYMASKKKIYTIDK